MLVEPDVRFDDVKLKKGSQTITATVELSDAGADHAGPNQNKLVTSTKTVTAAARKTTSL